MDTPINLFNIKFDDGSQRIISYSSDYPIMPINNPKSRISFCYAGPKYIEITPHFIAWINNRFLLYFNTNPILWAISVSTCPEELQPYLILPDDQLTYKGTI